MGIGKGGQGMPTVIRIGSYTIFIWTNDHEPVHVHVCKGKPSQNATKIIVPADGAPKVEHNKSKIPNKDIKIILRWISQNKGRIYLMWYSIHQK